MNSKNTKRALFSSVIALVLCFAMMLGTTFAWFTDEVTSSNNIIKSGTLDVELLYGDSKDAITNDASEGAIFDYKFWEPGYTQTKFVKIVNKGNLAFKFQLNIISELLPAEGDANLAEVIDVYMFEPNATIDRATIAAATPVGTLADLMADTDGAAHGILLPAKGVGSDDYNKDVENPRGEISYGIVLKMREEAGNEYQDLSVGEGFSVQLVATQYTWEKDSFDHNYDKNSQYDKLPAATVSRVNAEGVSTYLIKDIINDGIGSGVMTELTLDTAYSFEGEPVENAEQSPYANWFVDFYVSLDKAPAEGLVLSGQYGSWDEDNWYAFYVPIDLVEAGEFYPLLGTVTGGGVSNWEYTEICSGVGTFNCGAVDMNGLNEGTTMTVELRVINPENTDETITVKSIEYTFGYKPYTVTNSAELAAAIEAGYTDLYLVNGTYQMPAAAKGKTLTISGTEDAIIEVVPAGQGEANGQLDYNLDGSNVTFNGVTIQTNSQLYAGYARLSAVYNDCVIQNTYNLGVGTSEFNNCVFNITNEYLRVGGANSATFNGCTFNTDGRAILVFQDGTNVAQTVTVKDCTFNATAAAQTWNGIHVAAVSYDGSQGGTYVVNFEGNNVVDSDFNGLWQIKAGETNVTVNGLN